MKKNIFFLLVTITCSTISISKNCWMLDMVEYPKTYILGLDMVYNDFSTYGVGHPEHTDFRTVGYGGERVSFDFTLGFSFTKAGLRFFGEIDYLQAIRRENDAKKVWEKKYLTESDTVELSKANLYHKNYSFYLSYPFASYKNIVLTSGLGFQSWQFYSEFELTNIDDSDILESYKERKRIKSFTVDLSMLFYYRFQDNKPRLLRDKFGNLNCKWGVYIEPTLTQYLANNIFYLNMEAGFGKFIVVTEKAVYRQSFYIGASMYIGEMDGIIYKIGYVLK